MTHKMTSEIIHYSENGIDYTDYFFTTEDTQTVITRIDEPLYNEVEYVGHVEDLWTSHQERIFGTTLLGMIHAAQLAIDELEG